MNKVIVVFFVLLLSVGVVSALTINDITSASIYFSKDKIINSISSCGTISSSGTYYLSNDVAGSNICFNIQASDVTLDCAGYSINGVGIPESYAILNEGDNFKIENCVFNDFTYGIFNHKYVKNQTITQNTFSSTIMYGAHLKGNRHFVFNNDFFSVTGINGEFNYTEITDNVFNGLNSKIPKTAGIIFSGNSNLIERNKIYRHYYGISIEIGILNKIITNSIIGAGGDGIMIAGADRNIIQHNSINARSGASIQLYNSKNNRIVENKMDSERNLLIKSTSSDNIVYGNQFYGGQQYHISNSAQNQFANYVFGIAQGNYYDDILNYDIFDSNGDGYGDSGIEYPYDCGEIKWIGVGNDFGPIGARQVNKVIQ